MTSKEEAIGTFFGWLIGYSLVVTLCPIFAKALWNWQFAAATGFVMTYWQAFWLGCLLKLLR